jgi:hypothetical protein
MMAGRFSGDPLMVALGCLVWIPVCIWVISLIGWMVQGDIDFGSGIVGVFMGFALGVLTMSPPKKELTPLLFAAVLLTVVFFPLVRSALNRRSLDKLDIEAMENVYEMLRLRPDNSALQFKLARMLYTKGLRGHALVIGQAAIQHLPRQAFEEEHRTLNGWARTPMPPDMLRPLNCIECSHPNAPGVLFCQRCHSAFLMDHVAGRWVGRGQARKLLSVWAALMAGIVGIPFASSMLPPALALVVIVVVLAAAGVVVVLAFLPSKKVTT